MKSATYFFIFLLLIFPFVYAGSSTETSFTVPGCTLPSGERVTRNSCSLDKNYFCNYADRYIGTFGNSESGIACKGANHQTNADDCCPSGKRCSAEGCVAMTQACETFTSASTCEANGCSWIFNGIKELCRNTGSLSCSDYRTNTSCISDSMSLGKNGLGSELCRVHAYIGTKSVYNCHCEWNGTSEISGSCVFSKDVKETLFLGTPEGFTCQKVFNVGDCVNGEQIATWNASTVPENYGDTDAKRAEIAAAECVTGTSTLMCGERLIKLPFFSIFSLISVIFALAVFYLVKKH